MNIPHGATYIENTPMEPQENEEGLPAKQGSFANSFPEHECVFRHRCLGNVSLEIPEK